VEEMKRTKYSAELREEAVEPESNGLKAMQAEESYYRQPANSQKTRGYRFYLNLLATTKPVAIH
jgi:hypothetical protein